MKNKIRIRNGIIAERKKERKTERKKERKKERKNINAEDKE